MVSVIATILDDEPSSIRDIFNFYASMRNGITLKVLCNLFNPVELHIDERKLVQFGVLEGFIRRIYEVSTSFYFMLTFSFRFKF